MFLIKIFLKILISRILLIIPEKFISKNISIFKTGDMNTYEYSRHIFFDRHYHPMKKISYFETPVLMEIGPGNALTTCIFSKIVKAKKTYLIDSFDLADKDIKLYQKIIGKLPINEQKLFNSAKYNSFGSFLKSLNSTYETNCLKDLKNLDDKSIDYIFSHSVMEHVRLNELEMLIKEMYRILKKGGLISHVIDFSDHLGFGLNNLRFSKRIWESEFFAKSGFYTNRVSSQEMIKLFNRQNFRIVHKKLTPWDKVPIKKKKLHKDFSHFNKTDIKYHNLEIVMTK